MNPHAVQPWEQLFPPPDRDECTVALKMRLMCKRGEPLLLIPTTGTVLDAALSLYPAQSWKAKMARGGLSLMGKVGKLPGTTPVDLRFKADSPFVQFLTPPGLKADQLSFALLLGNPHAAGRRFVLLVFDAGGKPVRVVKAGAGGGRAVELIQNEAAFRKAVPATLLNAPAIQGCFNEDGVAALAMDYVAGPTPGFDDFPPAATILESWVSRERAVRFADLPAAHRLAAEARKDDATQAALAKLNQIKLHSAIHHGDFAPWNIRVAHGTKHWTVLDWERGEPAGPPAWDWFHFVIQPEVLVRRASPAAIVKKVEAFFRGTEFARYAAKAGIQASARELLLGYAIYCRDITRQTEGMPVIEALVDRLQSPPPQ